MFGFDFDIFWSAANAVLHGQSPYMISGYFSPYPLALLFIPLAVLPSMLAYGVWIGLNLILLAKSGNRWEFIKALLFFPVAFDLWQGQLDLLIFIFATRLNWFGVVLSTLRPQLAIWVIPFSAWGWFKDKKYDQFWKSALGGVVLYGIATLIEPSWWIQWFNAPKLAWEYNEQSASLFGLARILPYSHLTVFIAVSILAVLSFALFRPLDSRDFWRWVALFNPIANAYSLTILFDQVDWVTIVLALLALPLSQILRTNAIWSLIPSYLILKKHYLPMKRLSREAD